MTCSHTGSCELFAQFALNPALKVWQVHYCEGNYQQCARYQQSLSGASVPLNLLPNGARVEAPRSSDAYGAAALFNAILKDRGSMVESLLRHKVDVNATNADGTTALMVAVSKGNADLVQLLMRHGADPRVRDSSGRSALDLCDQTNRPHLKALLSARQGKRASAVTARTWLPWLRRNKA